MDSGHPINLRDITDARVAFREDKVLAEQERGIFKIDAIQNAQPMFAISGHQDARLA